MGLVISNPTHLDQCTTGRMHGRATAGTGPGEELSPADSRTLLDVYSTDQVDSAIAAIDLSPYATIVYVDAAIDTCVPYTGATANLDMGAFGVTAATLTATTSVAFPNGSISSAGDYVSTRYVMPRSITVNGGGSPAIDMEWNNSGITLATGKPLAWTSISSASSTQQMSIVNNSTTHIDVRASSGLRVKTANGSADAPITCAALTASGAVTVPNNLASGSIIFSGTTSRIRSSGSSAYFEGQVSLSMGGTSISDVLTLSTANNTTPFARIVGYTNNSKSQLGLYTKSGQTVAPFLLGDSSLTALVGLSATADVLEINNGTTGTVRDVSARTGTFTGGTVIPGSFTVATLPSTSAAGRVTGARATVTDSNATITAGIGAVVAGGGTDIVCVMWDGTDWRIA